MKFTFEPVEFKIEPIQVDWDEIAEMLQSIHSEWLGQSDISDTKKGKNQQKSTPIKSDSIGGSEPVRK